VARQLTDEERLADCYSQIRKTLQRVDRESRSMANVDVKIAANAALGHMYRAEDALVSAWKTAASFR